MLYIDAKTNKIRLTHGDTAYLTINIIDDTTGEEYEMTDDDTLTMTVKKSLRDVQPAIQKINHGDNVFHILPSDTSDLSVSEYKYDVQLTTHDGDIYTIIEPSIFEIMPEVTS